MAAGTPSNKIIRTPQSIVLRKSTALLGQIYRTQSGRPQFPVENIDFNISHSGDWVAVLLHINESEKSAVGIDIEFPKKRNFSMFP